MPFSPCNASEFAQLSFDLTLPGDALYVPLSPIGQNSSEFLASITGSFAFLFHVDIVFLTMLITISNCNGTAAQLSQHIYSSFNATNPSLFSPFFSIPNVLVSGMTTGYKLAVVPRNDPRWIKDESKVYKSVMWVFIGVSSFFTLLQLAFYLNFRQSSRYRRLESHKRASDIFGVKWMYVLQAKIAATFSCCRKTK